MHRLNRAEYANAIRDLLALDVDTSALLPPDDAAYGFDNIADALGISPVLLERYLTAAGKISSLAVGDPATGPAGETFRIRQDASQDIHIEGLPIGTVGGILAKTTLPLDGAYDFSIKLFRTNLGVVRGLEYEHQLEYTVDGERVHLSKVGGEEDFKANLKNMTKAGDDVEARAHIRIPLKAGPHVITAAFLERTDAINPLRLQPFIRSSNDTLDTIGHPHLDTFTRHRSVQTRRVRATRRAGGRSSTCRPSRQAVTEDACARRIIATLARRAYRGQATPGDLDRLHEFYRPRQETGDLRDRHPDGAAADSGEPEVRVPRRARSGERWRRHRLPRQRPRARVAAVVLPVEQHPRRSAAARGGSRARCTRRPCCISRSGGCWPTRRATRSSRTSPGQWLYLRNLKSFQPNSLEFPDFDDNLRQAFQRETELFFASIMHEDRSVLDLMTADYTFLNERLAKHYGMPGIYGSHFRRVTLDRRRAQGPARQGRDSDGDVASGSHVAGRPRQVGARQPARRAGAADGRTTSRRSTKTRHRAGKILTMRERMEEHRKNPTCAACHKIMEPIGLSMENFDAVGAWRTRDGGTLGNPIDASGELLDGTKVDGVVTLRQALLRQPDLFVGTVAEKLMIYAPRPRPVGVPTCRKLRKIVRDSAAQNYRFSSLILGVVDSTAFQKRIKVAESRSTSVRLEANSEEPANVHHEDGVAPADVPARNGRDARPAAARVDGAGADGDGEDGGEPAAPVRRDLRPARRAPGLLDAEDRRARTSSSRRF